MTEEAFEETATMTDSLRPIWNMNCESIDLVLGAAFDERELENLICCAQPETECGAGCPQQLLADGERIAHRAHALCHSDGPTARRIQKQLDFLFADTMGKLRGVDPRHLANALLRVRPQALPDLASTVWAISRDPRPSIQLITREFLWRLRFHALRELCADRVVDGRLIHDLPFGGGDFEA